MTEYKSAEQVMKEWDEEGYFPETPAKKPGSLSIIDVLTGKNVITEAIRKNVPNKNKKK